MRVFVSAGEPSGDLHGANLVRALRNAHPGVEVVGLGGERMAAAGCELLYPLAEHPVMGLGGILSNIPTFYRILGQARDLFRQRRPDAVVLIDYPGFHWWLAGYAKKHGLPVSYFVPPQVWAWASWRVRKMRRLTDQVLSALPFEHDWFSARGVRSRYIGHPYFDELNRQRLDEAFVARQRQRAGTVIALLPGSRRSELEHNLDALGRAAAKVHQRKPDTRFLVACFKPEHAEAVRQRLAGLGLPLEVHHGRTPEIIHLAHSCLSVSGSVSLELLHHEKPSVLFYRVGPATFAVARLSFDLKSITLVNLLAGRRVYPDYVACTTGRKVYSGDGAVVADLADLLAGHVLSWLEDPAAHERLRAELRELKGRFAQPGACERAAAAVLELARGEGRRAA